MHCSWEYFKNTEFANYSVVNIKECLINYSEKIGENVWPGYSTEGFIILIVLIIVGYLFYKATRRKNG